MGGGWELKMGGRHTFNAIFCEPFPKDEKLQKRLKSHPKQEKTNSYRPQVNPFVLQLVLNSGFW